MEGKRAVRVCRSQTQRAHEDQAVLDKNQKPDFSVAERNQKALKMRVETAEKSLAKATKRDTVENLGKPKSHSFREKEQ